MEREEPGGADIAALRESEAEFRAAFEVAPDVAGPAADIVDVAFSGEVIVWRVRRRSTSCGCRTSPPPPSTPSRTSRATAGGASRWAPRSATREFGTALIPKDGGYLLPLKAVVRKAEGLEQGDTVPVRMVIRT